MKAKENRKDGKKEDKQRPVRYWKEGMSMISSVVREDFTHCFSTL